MLPGLLQKYQSPAMPAANPSTPEETHALADYLTPFII